MSASISIAPSNLSLSKDDHYVVLGTDLVSFDAAVVRLNCGDTAAPAAGNVFSLAWENTSLEFTWAASPDASGYQLPLRESGGGYPPDYRARLEEAFRQNEILVRYWTIVNSSANNVLRFFFRISQPLTATVSSNATGMATIQEETGAYPASEDNLRAIIQLYEADDDDTIVATLEGDYATRYPYECSFNLRELSPVSVYLPPVATLAATVPSVNDYSVNIATDAYRAMYLRYADKYGTPPIAEALAKSGTFYVIHGGSPGNSPRIFGSTGARWLCHSYYDSTGAAFRKPILEDQPDYVFIWSNATAITVGMKLVVYYSDGTSDSLPVPGSSTMTIAANTLYCFPSGPQQMGISYATNYATKTAVAYDFQLTISSYTVALFTVRYDLLLGCPPWQQVLAYSNGLGGIETVALVGKASYDYNAEREIFERSRYRGFAVSDGENLAYNARGQQAWQANTGYLPRAYADHLRQLLLGETWLIDRQNLRYQRVQVTDTRYSHKDDEDLYSLTISFYLSTMDESYHSL
ncbi:MAG: hypothetical protein KDC54_11465 [Lewinella sp.]|nr:hypothetical protein [Lewinella sp.]